MYILSPMKMDGLASLESKITFNSVTSALARLHKRKISVAIPIFKIDADLNLIKMLKAMGMTRVFDNADLSGITKTGGLFMKDVFHKATIKVDEQGTESAAATSGSNGDWIHKYGLPGRPPFPVLDPRQLHWVDSIPGMLREAAIRSGQEVKR